MSAERYQMQHDEADLAAEITRNYEQMLAARSEGNDVLELTFEQRMNTGLNKYKDLARFAGQAVLLENPEGA